MSLGAQLKLLWIIVKNLTVLLLPITGLLGLTVISSTLLPATIAVSIIIHELTTDDEWAE